MRDIANKLKPKLEELKEKQAIEKNQKKVDKKLAVEMLKSTKDNSIKYTIDQQVLDLIAQTAQDEEQRDNEYRKQYKLQFEENMAKYGLAPKLTSKINKKTPFNKSDPIQDKQLNLKASSQVSASQDHALQSTKLDTEDLNAQEDSFESLNVSSH